MTGWRQLAVAGVLVVAAAGVHAETRPHYGGTIDATLLGAPASLDPVAARTHADITVVDLLFDTLYRVGPDGVALPRLAAALPVDDARRGTVRIALRRGIKLHDGSELAAADIVASLERARTSAPWLLATIASITAAGDAIELTTRAPVGDLAIWLALPQTAITKAGKPPGERAIGSGPFALDAIDRARKRLVLRAFDDHFAGPPYVQRLVLHWYDTPDGEARQFEAGDAHISARGTAAFAGAQPKYRADDVEGPAALLVFVGFGRAHPTITGERAFRQALDLAIARGGLAIVTSGERVVPTRLPVPVEAGAAALAPSGASGDVDAARRALGPLAQKLAGQRLEILVEDARPDDREIAERVVVALDALGIAAVITRLPATALKDRVDAGKCDLWIGQLAEPVTAPVVWWAAAFAAGGDAALVPALRAGTLAPATAEQTFAQRLPIVPLMFRALRLWHRTDVRGLAFDASGRPSFADVFLFGAPTRGKRP